MIPARSSTIAARALGQKPESAGGEAPEFSARYLSLGMNTIDGIAIVIVIVLLVMLFVNKW
jgi:hypothetical protein